MAPFFFSSTENQKTVDESNQRELFYFGKIWILNLIQLNRIRLISFFNSS